MKYNTYEDSSMSTILRLRSARDVAERRYPEDSRDDSPRIVD